MTGTEENKARWILRLLESGRVNDAREELVELVAASTGRAPGLLSLRGPTGPATPELSLIAASKTA